MTLLVGGPLNGQRRPIHSDRMTPIVVSDPVTWQTTETHWYEAGDKSGNDALYWVASVFNNVGMSVRGDV